MRLMGRVPRIDGMHKGKTVEHELHELIAQGWEVNIKQRYREM